MSQPPFETSTQEILIRLEDRYASMLVRLWRPARPKASVFCLHGFTGNGSDFDYLAAFLAESGYFVICPDMMGRGRSAFLGSGEDYSPELYYKCLRELGQFAGKQNHFIGSSWGGTILLLFLYMTKTRADKIILNDVPMSGGAVVDDIRDQIRQDSTATFATQQEAEDYIRQTRRFMGRIDEGVMKRYVENKVIATDAGYRVAYDPATTHSFQSMQGRAYDLYAIAAKLRARILLTYGRDSRFCDRDAIARLNSIRPDIWHVDNIDAGHPPSLMTLDQALLVLGFLEAS